MPARFTTSRKEQDRLVLVMEFIEGESLARRVERGSLPAQEAGQIALALLSALDAFHKIGIVHRDLKPSNIGALEWWDEAAGLRDCQARSSEFA